MVLDNIITEFINQIWYLLGSQDTALVIILVYERTWILADKKSQICEDMPEWGLPLPNKDLVLLRRLLLGNIFSNNIHKIVCILF